MRTQNDLWRGDCGYWQNRLIHHNFLILRHPAWNGYANGGRRLAVCDVVKAVAPIIDWSINTITFNQTFVPQAQVVKCLQALELVTKVVTALLRAIVTYDPTQAMVVLFIGNNAVDINLPQDLAIFLVNGYEQVQRCRAVFQPDLITQGRCP